jgi:hypothetical protein
MRTSLRGAKSARLACETLEDRVNPVAAFGLSGTNLIAFDTAAPTVITATTAITGVTAGETLAGIDFRAMNNQLYALGVNPTADTGTLYTIDTGTGVATVVGTAGGVAFTTNGTTAVDLPDPATVGYGFDFNSSVDRIRIVAGTLNARLNPNAPGGVVTVDGDNSGASSGNVPGINPDGSINGGPTSVNGAAYTNVSATPSGVTTLYTLDSGANALYIQSPANGGTQSNPPLPTGVDFTAVNGFDIPEGVNVTAPNAPATGSGFVALTVGAATGLYTINLATGAVTPIGLIGAGTAPISGFTLVPVGTIQFQNATLSVVENVGGGNLTVTLTRTGVTTNAATVTINSTDGSATGGGTDFTSGPYTVNFDPSETTKTFTIPINDDAADEMDETFTLTIANITGGNAIGAPSTATVTITDNEGPGTIQFQGATSTVAESAGNATITLTRTGGTTGAIAVTVTATGGTATAGTDFTGAPYTVNFANGDTTATLTIPITDDTAIEGDETTNLTITAAGAATIGTPAGNTLTITDNDFTVQFQGATTTVAESAGNATFTLTRTGATAAASAVTVTVTGGTATEGTDFTAGPYTVNFAIGATTATLTIPIVDDALVEGNETAVLTISAVGGSGGAVGAQATNTLTITDNDSTGTIAFQSATSTVAEDGTTAAIVLTRLGGTTGAITATVNVTGGTATAGADFSAGPYTVNFADGQATATLSIPITNDTLVEGNETVALTISALTGGGTIGAQATNTLTINDNDQAPPSPPTSPPTSPPAPFISDAQVFGNVLVVSGAGIPGGTAVFVLPPGSTALFADLNGDGNEELTLFMPTLAVVFDGATGGVLALAIDNNGDGFRDLLVFNADGTTTTLDGRTGVIQTV